MKELLCRAWYVRRLDNRSNANGRNDLDNDNGRLVGIAPEALGAPGKGASNIRAYSMADVQTAKKQLDTLAQVVKPENLESVKSLIAKL